jgi:hypothetical protein
MVDQITGSVRAHPRLAWAALGFGLAGLISSWHAVSAPFGLAVGLASALLAARALRAGEHRRSAAAALAVALAAVLLSAVVLARAAGGGRPDGAAAILQEPAEDQGGSALDGETCRPRPFPSVVPEN